MKISELSGRLFLLGHLRKNYIREHTQEYDLSHGRLPVLECIIHKPGCTQREIAALFAQSPAAITQTTKKLEAAGLIERRVEKDDLRCHRLYATEAGLKAATLFRQVFDEIDAVTYEGFTEEERAQLAELLDRMARNLGADFSRMSPPWNCK